MNPILSFHVAGVQHGDVTEVRDIQSGMELVLRPEPDNEHDPDAILVLTKDGIKLGYVPRKFTAAVHGLNAKSINYTPVLTVKPGAPIYNFLKVDLCTSPKTS